MHFFEKFWILNPYIFQKVFLFFIKEKQFLIFFMKYGNYNFSFFQYQMIQSKIGNITCFKFLKSKRKSFLLFSKESWPSKFFETVFEFLKIFFLCSFSFFLKIWKYWKHILEYIVFLNLNVFFSELHSFKKQFSKIWKNFFYGS